MNKGKIHRVFIQIFKGEVSIKLFIGYLKWRMNLIDTEQLNVIYVEELFKRY